MNATKKDVFLQKTKRCYPHYVKEDSILCFMYTKGKYPPLCHGQSVLIKGSPTVVILYILTKERSVLMTHTKERCQFPTDILIIPYTFLFVSAFCKNFQKIFFKEKDNSDFTELPFLKSLVFIVIDSYPYLL